MLQINNSVMSVATGGRPPQKALVSSSVVTVIKLEKQTLKARAAAAANL